MLMQSLFQESLFLIKKNQEIFNKIVNEELFNDINRDILKYTNLFILRFLKIPLMKYKTSPWKTMITRIIWKNPKQEIKGSKMAKSLNNSLYLKGKKAKTISQLLKMKQLI